MTPELISLLISAPDTQLDSNVKPLIKKWDTPPKALQILEVLDACVHGGLASTLVVKLLEKFMHEAIQLEGTTYEALVAQATWRSSDGK